MTTSNRNDAGRQSHSDDHDILNIISCLLADVRELSQVPIGPPDDITYDWVLKEGPKLDKGLLSWIEGTGELPVFPDWLKPLSDKFVSTLDATYLRYLRQILLFCYKIEKEPSHDQLNEAQKAFEETDESIETWSRYFSEGHNSVLNSTARQIIGRIIYGIDWSVIMPSHGPGAVYPPAKPWNKSMFTTVYPTIVEKYPIDFNYCAIPSMWDSILVVGDKYLKTSSDIVARLVAVPKDSRGPRLICVHPKEAIWIQQGCRNLLEQAITSPRSESFGRITFNDQDTNGSLALSSSSDRRFVTLDLKEASDRIGCELVRDLFGDHAYSYLSCSRATSVRLLDDRVMKLRKWAPMGNALCFPVQSLIFYSLVRSGIRCHYGINCNDVYVFGDDIILPSEYYDGAISALVRSGLVPNASKTFKAGFFRESCGVDAYRGKDVTPHRLRKVDWFTVSGGTSTCRLAKALYMDGYHHTADILYSLVSRSFGCLSLTNNPEAQGICRYINVDLASFMRYRTPMIFHGKWQTWMSRVLLVGGTTVSISNGAWWHLQDSLLRLSRLGFRYSERGLEYAVPHRVRSKRGWTEVLPTSMPPADLRRFALVEKRLQKRLDRWAGTD